MKTTSRFESVVRFGIIALGLYLVAATVILYLQIARVRDAQKWVDHTHDVRYALQDSLTYLLDAESAQRGYLLTKNDIYLNDYFAAVTRLHDEIKEVQDLVTDNPMQRSRADGLNRIINDKIDQLKDGIGQNKDIDISAATEDYRSGATRAAANAIRSTVDQMLDEEERLFKVRSTEMEEMTQLTILLFGALLALFAGVMGAYFMLANRNMAIRSAMLMELTEANAKTERADKFKGDLLNYLGRVLHEPLSKVMTNTDMLLLRAENKLPENDQKIVTEIRASVRFLLSLATNFLHIGRLQAGKPLYLEEDDVNLADVLRDVVGMVGGYAAKVGITLRQSAPFERALIRCDKQKLRQILLNLLDNAIKNTPSGGNIELTAAQVADGAITVTVRDTGPGISPERLKQANIPFAQIDDMSTRQEQGIGLGLPMALGFAQAHGGTLEITSDEHGTTAVLTLPANRVIRVFEPA